MKRNVRPPNTLAVGRDGVYMPARASAPPQGQSTARCPRRATYNGVIGQ
jgi:hypothetical protein